MKTKVILFLSMIMLTFGCKHSKSAQKTVATGPETYRVIVSFISKASGTDKQKIAGVDSYLLSFGKKYGKTIACVKVPWGREGEVDYCFKLKELSDAKQKEFVQGLNNVTKGSDMVFITENQACSHR